MMMWQQMTMLHYQLLLIVHVIHHLFLLLHVVSHFYSALIFAYVAQMNEMLLMITYVFLVNDDVDENLILMKLKSIFGYEFVDRNKATALA